MEKQSIKFMTVNILNGGKFMENLVPFLKQESPDIVVMQEVYNGKDERLPLRERSFSYLTKELGFPHAVFSPLFYDTSTEKNVDVGNAILSKFPLDGSSMIFFDNGYGPFDVEGTHDFTNIQSGIQKTTAVINGKNVVIGNVHGIWGLDGGDSDRRLRMSQIIADQIKDEEYVILAGDFNLKPGTQTIANIEKHLISVFKEELVSTFNMKHKKNPGYATAVVDMIFISSNIRIIEHVCPQVDVSDHYPLIANLELA